jgi:hypothetical protein
MTSLVVFLALLGSLAGAEIPQMISYQGKVTDASGTPVADGSYTMRFRIYDAVSAGTLLWDSGAQPVTVAGGIFSVLLGESPQPAIMLDFNADYWLQVTFSGVDQAPRQRLASTGYAYMASGLVAGTEVSGAVTTGTLSALKGTNTATAGQNYGGVFTASSSSGRGVYGLASATTGETYGGLFEALSPTGRAVAGESYHTSGDNYGGYFRTWSTAGTGVYGEATATSGTTCGLYGRSASTSGRGVYGGATATGGHALGVLGESASTGGSGVHGNAYATSGYNYGVYGISFSPLGRGVCGIADCYGVLGVTHSTTGCGVRGWATDTSGTAYGVYGLSDSGAGHGVYGYASATSGTTYGVYGVTASGSGYGVYGLANVTSGTSYGIWGQSNSSAGIGVHGTSPAKGVSGVAGAPSGTTYGVYGESSSTAGRGVHGEATATSGTTYGGRFVSSSTAGLGVYGGATASSGYTQGGHFESASTDGHGVYASADATSGTTYGVEARSYSTAGFGVFGVAYATSGTTYGVYGATNSPSGFGGAFWGRLRATASINATGTPDNHLALLHNTSTGTSPDVLCLKVGYTGNPGSAINYLTFVNGTDTGIGAVEGDGAGGVTFLSGGSDYAEYLPRRDEETLEPGDVVGVFEGEVTKRTEGASQVMVVSTRPIVLGNNPGEDKTEGYARVAFIGQVEVKVRGSVEAGDLLMPSGLGDGTAVAVSGDEMSAAQFRQVFGQAWEGSGDSGVKRIRAAVGLLQHDPSVARLEAENRALRGENAEMREAIGALRERVEVLEGSR